jgi:hypothetical protein
LRQLSEPGSSSFSCKPRFHSFGVANFTAFYALNQIARPSIA